MKKTPTTANISRLLLRNLMKKKASKSKIQQNQKEIQTRSKQKGKRLSCHRQFQSKLKQLNLMYSIHLSVSLESEHSQGRSGSIRNSTQYDSRLAQQQRSQLCQKSQQLHSTQYGVHLSMSCTCLETCLCLSPKSNAATSSKSKTTYFQQICETRYSFFRHINNYLNQHV